MTFVGNLWDGLRLGTRLEGMVVRDPSAATRNLTESANTISDLDLDLVGPPAVRSSNPGTRASSRKIGPKVIHSRECRRNWVKHYNCSDSFTRIMRMILDWFTKGLFPMFMSWMFMLEMVLRNLPDYKSELMVGELMHIMLLINEDTNNCNKKVTDEHLAVKSNFPLDESQTQQCNLPITFVPQVSRWSFRPHTPQKVGH